MRFSLRQAVAWGIRDPKAARKRAYWLAVWLIANWERGGVLPR